MKCPKCGGEIDEEGMGCEFCGSKFTSDELRRISMGIKGAYELKKGELEKERMLKKADTHLVMKDYDSAIRSYRDVSYEYPDDYRGWLGEVNCRTHNFTDFTIGKIGVQSVQNIVDKALMVAPNRQKTFIQSKWNVYANECIHIEDDTIRKKQEEIAKEQTYREASELEQRKMYEAEVKRQRIQKEIEEKLLRRKNTICLLAIVGLEIFFFIFMRALDVEEIINGSFGGFIGINVTLLVNVLIIGIIDRIGRVGFGTYIASGISTIFAIGIFFSAMGAMDGLIDGMLAFFFFGVIELGVIGLSNFIAYVMSGK